MTERIRIAPLDELPQGRGVVVEAAGHRIAMFRIEDSVYAVGDRCSHAEASLAEGELFDTEIECPRHGASFDLKTGNALTLPASKPVPVYDIEIAEGDVYLNLDRIAEEAS
jgi:3-phenylpropionate/trans-cinnamate dioxygenase ferredoxin subunit